MHLVVALLLSGLAVVYAASSATQQPPPQVRVEQGKLRGTYLQSSGGRTFAAFLGVPYARPPVGKHRFKEPVPFKPWEGVWYATEYGSACLQYEYPFKPDETFRVTGDENCLFINVYTPKLPTTSSVPHLDVFVHIHGGSFMNGAGAYYGPEFLLDHDVVVVTFNYRVGILGFLSTEDEVVPGNNGLKDQTAALRWIQRNIAVFGGNPAKVTIHGLSAGGASVHYHYLSPQSQGLFQQGMSMSGTALTCWSQAEAQRSNANKLGELLGCRTHSSHELVDCLRHRPARQIVQQTGHFLKWRFNPFSPFGPTVEVAGDEPFLSKHPVNVILEGGAQDLPWITSITTAEGLWPVGDFATKESVLEELDKQFETIAPHLLHYNFTVPISEQKMVADKIRTFYFGEEPISVQTVNKLIQLAGDRTFTIEAERAARLMAAANSAPVYFYKFGYRGNDSFSRFLSSTDTNLGVSHADDVSYILKMQYCNTEKTQADKDMSKLMINICLNFMKNGDPSPSGQGVTWKPVTKYSEQLDFLHITGSSQVEMKSSADLGNRAFWDSLPIQEETVGVTSTKEYLHSDEL